MKKSPEKLIAYLEKFNKWRRGCAYQPQPHPKKVGDAIDQAVEMLKTMNKTSKEEIIELHTGKTVEEIEKNNRIVKTLVSWQPMETAPQDHLFVGIYGPIDPPLWKEYSFFYAIGDGLYKCREINSVTFPNEHCEIFGWVEIPKYEGWSGTQWQLRPETPSSSDHEYQVKAATDMLTSLEKRLQKP